MGAAMWVLALALAAFAVESPGAFHPTRSTDLVWVSRVVPEYPAAARTLGQRDGDCRVRVFIDERGSPVGLEFVECPDVFRDATRAGVMASRWEPPVVHGVNRKARITLIYRYIGRHPIPFAPWMRKLVDTFVPPRA